MSTRRLLPDSGNGSQLSTAARCCWLLMDISQVAGEILLSGTDDHLLVGEDRRLHYSPEPKESSYRPSVDVFFNTVRLRTGPGRASPCVLLTGMLRDSAQGLLNLRGCGWRTIAQDESSSVVWGMPKAAVEIGAATKRSCLFPESPKPS